MHREFKKDFKAPFICKSTEVQTDFIAFFFAVCLVAEKVIITPNRTHKENLQCYNDFIFEFWFIFVISLCSVAREKKKGKMPVLILFCFTFSSLCFAKSQYFGSLFSFPAFS